jgi:hypothetical protein
MDLGAGFLEGGAFLGVEGLEGVVATLRVEGGTDGTDDAGGALGVVDSDVVDGAEGGKDAGAVLGAIHGTGGAFEGADGGVGIDGDGEGVAEGAGALEVIDVAGVKDVEAAVGEDEAAAFGAESVGFGGKVFEGEDGGHFEVEAGRFDLRRAVDGGSSAGNARIVKSS